MNILRLLLDNLRLGTISFTLPHDHQCTSSQYRGLIHNDESRCVGCGSCAYVCPTGAIEVTRTADTYRWTYDPGKCTFCARCIDRCRPNTLTIESRLPPLYGRQGELIQVMDMVKKKPIRPVAPAAAAGAAVSKETTIPGPSLQPAVERAS